MSKQLNVPKSPSKYEISMISSSCSGIIFCIFVLHCNLHKYVFERGCADDALCEQVLSFHGVQSREKRAERGVLFGDVEKQVSEQTRSEAVL